MENGEQEIVKEQKLLVVDILFSSENNCTKMSLLFGTLKISVTEIKIKKIVIISIDCVCM